MWHRLTLLKDTPLSNNVKQAQSLQAQSFSIRLLCQSSRSTEKVAAVSKLMRGHCNFDVIEPSK